MRISSSLRSLALLVVVGTTALGAACSSQSDPDSNATTWGVNDSGANNGGEELGDGGIGAAMEGGPNLLVANDSGTAPFAMSPTSTSISVPYGTHSPTVAFAATAGGMTVPASFTVDLGSIATINASTGVLTPTGVVGGVVHVTATFGSKTLTSTVTVTVTMQDNGAPGGYDAGVGTGGNDGVGGNGPGGAVSSGAQGILGGAPVTDTGLTWLYPYDKTVWPQGLLAPLLQWGPGAVGNYDAVYIHLSEKGFDYKGYFAANATTFNNTPILQKAWDALSYSNQGEPVAVSLVFSSGGKAYGPLTETWSIAPGSLTGTVYYQSYGTSLVTNYCAGTSWLPSGETFCFGGATLGIKHGATSPELVAGTNSPSGDQSGCRVCHSVAAQGSVLITQHGDNYSQSSAYSLAAPITETTLGPASDVFAFPAISPDGTMLFNNAAPLTAVSAPAATSGLYSVPSGNPIPATGLPAGLQAATPSFSPDGSHIAFGDYGTDQVSLASIDYNPTTSTFSNKQTLDTPADGSTDLYPAFFPTNDAVIFERELPGGSLGATSNTHGQLWWADLKTHTATELKNLNGEAYLPTTFGTNHATDWNLQYEPTINPVTSGGYAWVVFTSRRLYGNVATQDPYLSDPRSYDPRLSANTKKLWVAAIDLNAAPGTDPSHPAFYLPAQELLAGNSRGFWVVDPCEKTGVSCLTGDQCCSGYCGSETAGAAPVCGSPPPGCISLTNKCTTNSDCCGSSTGIECIGGFCASPAPASPK